MMTLRSYDMLGRIGEGGFKLLGLDEALDRRVPTCDELAGPSLLLWHGRPDRAVKDLLKGKTDLWILCAGKAPVLLQDDGAADGRSHGLPWGLSKESWQTQKWQRDRMKEFVESAQLCETGPPDWSLLAPPQVPEHVIACYLCALADVLPESVWQAGFEDEVEYWKSQEVQSVPQWNRGRPNAEILRKFLRGVGALVEGREGSKGNASV